MKNDSKVGVQLHLARPSLWPHCLVRFRTRLRPKLVTSPLGRHLASLITFLLIAALSMPGAIMGAPMLQTLPIPLTGYAPVTLTLTDGESTIELTRVDFWPTTVIFLGTWTTSTSSVCIGRSDFALLIGGIEYEAASRDVVKDDIYSGVEAPGSGLFNLCGSNETRQVAIPFQALLSDESATFVFHESTATLPASLLDLREAGVTPQPTHTPTFTPTGTPTPTPTPTFTPASVSVPAPGADEFALPFSNAARSIALAGEVGNLGIRFHLQRVDFWDELPGNKRPQNDLFVVLTGYLTPDVKTTGRGCIRGDEVHLLIGNQSYRTDNMREAKRFYDTDYPGYITPQCASGSKAEPTFMVFDVPLAQEPATLNFHNARLGLGVSIADLAAASVVPSLGGPSVAVVPTELPTTSATIVPTRTPAPSVLPATETPTFTATSPAVSPQTPTPKPTGISAIPLSTNTPRPTRAPTATPVPSSTPLPTATPSPTRHPTVTPSGVTVSTTRNANLRSGPGTEYEIAGGVQAGETLVAIGRNPEGTWLLLDSGSWIAAFLITGPTGNLPVVSVPAGPQPTATLDLPVAPAATPTLLADDLAAQKYASEMQSYLTVFGSAFEDLSTMFAEVGESPWVMLDDGWRGKVVADFVLIKLATEAIREVTPPAVFAEAHAKFLEATEHVDKAIEYYASGIDGLDAELMTLGNEEAEAGNRALVEAKVLLEALMP